MIGTFLKFDLYAESSLHFSVVFFGGLLAILSQGKEGKCQLPTVNMARNNHVLGFGYINHGKGLDEITALIHSLR